MNTQKPEQASEKESDGLCASRRDFLKLSSAVAAASITPSIVTQAADKKMDEQIADYFEKAPLHIEVNGKPYDLQVEPRVTLLDLLREQLHLYGTKKGCDHGQCGAC